MAKVDITSSE